MRCDTLVCIVLKPKTIAEVCVCVYAYCMYLRRPENNDTYCPDSDDDDCHLLLIRLNVAVVDGYKPQSQQQKKSSSKQC